MDNVRLYHQSLQEQTASQSFHSSSAGDINPSSSILFSALRYQFMDTALFNHLYDWCRAWALFLFYRKKLSELDNIQKYFSRKLSTPTFPPMPEQESHNKHEKRRDSEYSSSKLLLKSNQLVGEVHNIISGEFIHLLLRSYHHFQSGFWRFHWIETALLRVSHDILRPSNKGNCSLVGPYLSFWYSWTFHSA